MPTPAFPYCGSLKFLQPQFLHARNAEGNASEGCENEMREHCWPHMPSFRRCHSFLSVLPFRDEEFRKEGWPMSWWSPCAGGDSIRYASEEAQTHTAVLSSTVSFGAYPLALSFRVLLCSTFHLATNGLQRTFLCLPPCSLGRHMDE